MRLSGISRSNYTTPALKIAPEVSVFYPSTLPDYTLVAESGSYTYTGTSADLIAARVLAADSGTYTYSGTAAVLAYGRIMTADSGTYTYTGTAASLLASRVMTADSGVYTYTGSSVTLNYSGALDVADIDGRVTINSGSAKYTMVSVTAKFTIQ